MSYEDEKILSGKLCEMKAEDFEGLCAVLIENPSYCKAAGMHSERRRVYSRKGANDEVGSAFCQYSRA